MRKLGIHNISRNGVICLSMLHCLAAKRRKDLAQTRSTEIVSRKKKGHPLYTAQRNAIKLYKCVMFDFFWPHENIFHFRTQNIIKEKLHNKNPLVKYNNKNKIISNLK